MFQLLPINKKDSTKLTYSAKVNIKGMIKPYFYTIKFALDEENLCKMEMKTLFNKIPCEKHFLSYHHVNPSRSPFLKECISILYTGNTLKDIVHQITKDKLSFEKFKVSYVNYGDETLHLDERRKIECLIGMNIKGEAEMENPELLLGITKVHDKWILGEHELNESKWYLHDRKPYSYSNALGVKVSRAIVNIAVSNNLKLKVIDPCCGVGTVLVEALSQGIDIIGYELNPMIAENARKNLSHFGYKKYYNYRQYEHNNG